MRPLVVLTDHLQELLGAHRENRSVDRPRRRRRDSRAAARVQPPDRSPARAGRRLDRDDAEVPADHREFDRPDHQARTGRHDHLRFARLDQHPRHTARRVARPFALRIRASRRLQQSFAPPSRKRCTAKSLATIMYRARHADQHYVWLETTLQRMKDAAGEETQRDSMHLARHQRSQADGGAPARTGAHRPSDGACRTASCSTSASPAGWRRPAARARCSRC